MNRKLILFVSSFMFFFAGSTDLSPEYYFNSWEQSGADGMYFLLPDGDYLLFAKGEGAALHEVGHISDRERGYVSKSPVFEEAVIDYLESADPNEQPYWRINYFYEQGLLDEVYAEFYVWNILYSIPQEMEPFYN